MSGMLGLQRMGVEFNFLGFSCFLLKQRTSFFALLTEWTVPTEISGAVAE